MKEDSPDLRFSTHALDMLEERGIETEWAYRTIGDPELVQSALDGTMHYLRPIEERGGRWLRVVVNVRVVPPRVVTLFFDRRLGRKS